MELLVLFKVHFSINKLIIFWHFFICKKFRFFIGQVIDSVRDCLDAHKLIFRCDSQGHYSYQPVEKPKDLQGRAAARLVVQQYTNQLLAPLINIAVYGLIQRQRPGINITTLKILHLYMCV